MEDDAVFNSIFGGNAAGSEDDVVIDPVGLENGNDAKSKATEEDSSAQPYQYPYPTDFDREQQALADSEDGDIELIDMDESGEAAGQAPPLPPPLPAPTDAPVGQIEKRREPEEVDTTGMVIPITEIEKEQAAKDEQGSQHGPRIDPMLLRFMGIENRNDLGTNLMDLDMDNLPQKPWRDSGADITDWFNYGFTEDTWRAYCAIQVKMRMHLKRTTNSQEVLAQQQQLLHQAGLQGNVDKGRTNDRRSGVCFDFQNKGFCSRGASCRWAHLEKSEGQKFGAPPGVCFDFQNKGYCSWGNGCRWKHVDKSGTEHERNPGFDNRGRSPSRSPSMERGRRRMDDRRGGRQSTDEKDDNNAGPSLGGPMAGMLPGGVVPPHFRNLMMPNGRLLMPGVIPGLPGAGGPAIPAPNMPMAALTPGMRQMALQQMLANNPNVQELMTKANESNRGHDKERHHRRHHKDRNKDGDRRKRRHDRDSDRKHRDRDRNKDRKRRSRSPRSRSRDGRDERKRHKKTKTEKKSA